MLILKHIGGQKNGFFIQTIMEIVDRPRYEQKVAYGITGISKSTLDKMYRGEYVSMEVIDRICHHLNCDVSSVIVYTEEK